MNSFLRKLRGIVGTGISWGTVWGIAGAGLHFLTSAFGSSGFVANSLLADMFAFATMGFFGGFVFSTGFLVTEGRRTLSQLKAARGGLWGALAGLTGPALAFIYVGGVPVEVILGFWPILLGTAVFGAGSGAAMTALAKSDMTDSLESGESERQPTLPSGD